MVFIRFFKQVLIASALLVSCLLHAADIVYLDTDEGRSLLQESLGDARVVALLMNYETQKTTSYCGVASLVMTYNALGVNAPPSDIFPQFNKFSQNNIFDESFISVIEPDCITVRGLELDEVANIAKKQGLIVEKVYGDALELEPFRRKLRLSLTQPGTMVIANYYRPFLNQGQTGHFSPIAAYNVASDRFLILDTARYRLPPSWIKTADLYQSMQQFSAEESRRGFLLLEKKAVVQEHMVVSF